MLGVRLEGASMKGMDGLLSCIVKLARLVTFRLTWQRREPERAVVWRDGVNDDTKAIVRKERENWKNYF